MLVIGADDRELRVGHDVAAGICRETFGRVLEIDIDRWDTADLGEPVGTLIVATPGGTERLDICSTVDPCACKCYDVASCAGSDGQGIEG